MIKELKNVAIEMGFGIALFEVLLIAFFFFVPIAGYSRWSLIMGVFVGTILCTYMLIDLARTTEDTAASKDSEYARKKAVKHAMIRKVVIIVVVILFWKSRAVNVLGIVFALFGLKCGAYLQPIVHKYKTKRKED